MGTVDWGQAVVIFVLGIGTVFTVLILLWAILKLMAVVFGGKNTPSKPVQTPSAPAAAPAPAANVAQAVAVADDSELVAVLTAAVAACMNTSTYNLKIRNYRKLGSPASVWNSVSRRENIDSQIF